MLFNGDTVEINGREFLVVEVYQKAWLEARTSPHVWVNPDYGVLLRDKDQYHWRGLVKDGQMDLKPMGTKYCPPAAPTEEQLRSFKERMQKLAAKRKEENEQLKEEIKRSTPIKKSVVLHDDLGLPAKAPRRAKKGKLARKTGGKGRG